MVFKSNHPDIEIPQDGIFQYVMSNQKGISDNKIIYLDVNTSKGYTFGKLKSESKRFASGLRDKVGFKRGDVLAIYSSNQVDYPMVLLGTIAAGGKVTPVDPKYIANELSYQLLDSGASILIVHPDLLETAIAASKEINNPNFRIFLFGDNEIRGYKPFRSELIGEREFVPIFYTPEEANSTIAYICYSSGTTGKQKGVEITHTNLVSNLAQIYNVEKDLGTHSVLAGPFYHIYALICCIHLTLIYGATLIIFPSYNIKTFCHCIQEYKIDYVHAAPPVILDLINYPDAKKYDLSSVKIIVSAGAPLSHELEYTFYELFKIRTKQAYDSNNIITGSVQLYNSFNNSNDNFLMIHNVQKIGSCGTLLPNIKVKILSNDGHGNIYFSFLFPGELCVHGPSIMKGYLNNSSAINAAFDKDDFLHTGDIAYVDDQGIYHIVDRKKELIKYKGFSVAPAELESILLTHDKISDAAVIGCYSEENQTELPIAYIVLKSEDKEKHPYLKNEIIQYVNSNVAPHKKIRDLLFIDKIPKSESGKILRRVLRDMTMNEYVEDHGNFNYISLIFF
ncbi:hypothetical protein C2G38_1981828 [Gigaspora rosea]|uniref:Acetyl-CoA synthetase-like protein n=1 Tax=Gigaspora rosea TaxID=44941 RepID=A0A397UPN8_9GLOM|nr:hypothetical protein C2G38_1981828 [Gigaspora rosea]